AEDGIRDFHVTGVQTCALPISQDPPCRFVIFGVTGDLSRRKLLPSLYDLDCRGLLDEALYFVGVGRREWDDDAFRKYLRNELSEIGRASCRERVEMSSVDVSV